MVSHHPAKFAGHSHCDIGNVIFLVVEEKDFRCFCFIPPLLFISKGNGLKAYSVHITNSDPGHIRLQQQSEKNMKIISVCLSKNIDEKEKK